MTYNEFALYYLYLPWVLAFLGIAATIFLLVMGGVTLRTLIGGKMNKRSQFVFSFTDGGLAHLKTMQFYGEHGVLSNDKEFMLYSTPISDNTYVAELLPYPENINADERKAIDEINRKRQLEADRLNNELPQINEESKKKSFFEGRPLWIGHEGLGVAVQPSLLEKMENAKFKLKKDAQQKDFTLVSFETIKDFMSMNFSPKRLMSIFLNGEDAGKYGRPKKPLPGWIMPLLLISFLVLGVGFLIVSGKLDLGGWVKTMTGGK